MDAKSNGNAHSPAYPWGEHGSVLGGLTKRELFAAMAMQGHIAASKPHSHDTCAERELCIKERAPLCVAWADALLAELAKDGAA